MKGKSLCFLKVSIGRFIKQKCRAIRRHLEELLSMARRVEERAPEVTEFAFAVSLYLSDLERALKES